MVSVKINKDKGEVLILKADMLLRPSALENIHNNVMQQIKEGVVIIPCGFDFDILKRGRMIVVDTWIDKLAKIISDPEAPEEYKDYCMHLVGEIEAEFRAQEVQAMKEGEEWKD